MHVIPEKQKVEVGRSLLEVHSGKRETQSERQTKAKRSGGMDHLVKCLPKTEFQFSGEEHTLAV
jgi:hypothetical protein